MQRNCPLKLRAASWPRPISVDRFARGLMLVRMCFFFPCDAIDFHVFRVFATTCYGTLKRMITDFTRKEQISHHDLVIQLCVSSAFSVLIPCRAMRKYLTNCPIQVILHMTRHIAILSYPILSFPTHFRACPFHPSIHCKSYT